MTTKPDILHNHRLRVRTLTPVSVGADEADALSPYADYVIEGDQIILLDKRRVERAVLEANLLDEYVTSIGDSMEQNPNRAGFNLGKFIRERLKKSPRDLAARMLPNHGIEPHRKQSIAAIVKDAGRAYLPGSSLKGAIRTAMLYDWLVNTEHGGKELRTYQKALPDLIQAQERVKKLEGIARRERRRPPELFDAKRTLRDQEKRFFQEEKLFGRLNDGPESRFIRVSDSSFASPESVGIYGISRIRLQPNPKVAGREKELPTPREALFADTPLDVKLDIVPGFAKASPLAYWAGKTTDELLQTLNNFTLDCLANELFEIRNADNRDFKSYHDRLENFYADLQNRALGGAVFLRLGFGKTRYENSLALAFFNGLPEDEREAAFLDYRWGMFGVSDDKRNDPVTMTVTAGGEPLGWVEVTKA